jgi:hypothetical protein
VTTTDALFAGEVQRKVSNGVASLAAAASSYRRKLLSSGARPGLRIANVAAQTRIVSAARPRLEFWKSVRPFKGIFCDDISEFESYMPSHAVGLSASLSPRAPPLHLWVMDSAAIGPTRQEEKGPGRRGSIYRGLAFPGVEPRDARAASVAPMIARWWPWPAAISRSI